MPQHPKSSEQRAKIIREAFESSQYPGDNRLVYDNSGSHLECNQVADAFRGKHWADLPVDFLRRHADSMFFFTPEAYCFYLPAYLLAAVLSYRDADVIPNNIVHTLTPPASGGPERELFESRVHGFDVQQRLATKTFLEFLSSEYSQDFPRGDPQIALDEYWS